MDLVFSGVDGKYGRNCTEVDLRLSEKIKRLYGKDNVIMTTSGMSAISQAINAIIMNSNHVHIIHDTQLYCETAPSFSMAKKIYGDKLSLEQVDFNVGGNLSKRAQMATNYIKENNDKIIIFAESVSNPDGRIFPFDELQKFKQQNKRIDTYITIIDNTWMSPVGCNPFMFGADVVVESMTKHISNGTAIGGYIVSNSANLSKKINIYHTYIGEHRSPYETEIISQNIDSLEDRFKISSDNALEVVKFLKKNEKIITCHPSLINTEVNAKNIGCLKYMPPIVTFYVPGPQDIDNVKMLINKCHNIDLKTSYSGPRCRINDYIKLRIPPYFPSDKAETPHIGPVCPHVQLRLYVGHSIGDVNEIIAELKSLLRELMRKEKIENHVL
jgi:cystathionine beta-lyase/cystathionine gamma-synthase